MVIKKQVTAMEFLEIAAQSPDKRFDIIDGQIVEVSPKRQHGGIQFRLAGMLGTYLMANPIGQGHTEVIHDLDGKPYIPDISINPPETGDILTQPPLLVVEIKSPSNTYTGLREKARTYLAAGAQMVWLVLPDPRLIEVYEPQADVQILTAADTLDGGDVLPGFTLPVQSVLD